ncbi:MAG: Periplasmic serine endoprotease DegP [Phycisphaerae bacterium]|nr:Periplasmic serine endoprotease DegP [Phycisphaerae bacterium]
MNRSIKTVAVVAAMVVLVGGVVLMAKLPGGLAVADDNQQVRFNKAYAAELAKQKAQYDAATARLSAMSSQVKTAEAISEVFHAVASKLEPSVVQITSEHTAQMPDLAPFEKFFDNPDDMKKFFENRPRTQRSVATGSGVIITKDGYVLTNNHVVAGAERVSVTLAGQDGESVQAKVIGADPRTDVAVIKIEDAKDLVPAELGDSDQMEVGDWVMAIGSPFGLSRSVTVGIVSAKGRANVGIADYEDFIQTDASINPGNSGGPLVNISGQVIGINTAIASRSGGNQGIGFSIPINMIKALLPRLEKGETIHRGYLGVLIQPLTRKLADSFNYDSTRGALVSQVRGDSPSKDRLQVGDIINEVDGRKVAGPNELRQLIAAVAPGQSVKLGVYRDGKQITVEVKLGELPDDEMRPGLPAPPAAGGDSQALLGIGVKTLTEADAKKLGLEGRKGVLVTAVDPDSEASREGLTPGDVITQVQGKAVADADAFAQALSGAKDRGTVRLLVISKDGGSRFVLLPLKK